MDTLGQSSCLAPEARSVFRITAPQPTALTPVGNAEPGSRGLECKTDVNRRGGRDGLGLHSVLKQIHEALSAVTALGRSSCSGGDIRLRRLRCEHAPVCSGAREQYEPLRAWVRCTNHLNVVGTAGARRIQPELR